MAEQGTRTAMAAGAVALQLAVLYAPRAPRVSTGQFPIDKVVHLAAFALPTAALLAAGVPRPWAIGLMAAHAPLSEAIQGSLLEGRSAEAGDVVADLAGVLVGSLLVR